MGETKLEVNQLKRLVEHKYSLIKTLEAYNPEGRYTFGQNCFCPFHHNENTPSASLLRGKEGSPDILYCHAEQKRYTAADVISKLMGYNIYEVGYLLWNDMTDHERTEFMESIGSINYKDYFGVKGKENNSPLLNNNKLLFKEGQISLEELFKSYLSEE